MSVTVITDYAGPYVLTPGMMLIIRITSNLWAHTLCHTKYFACLPLSWNWKVENLLSCQIKSKQFLVFKFYSSCKVQTYYIPWIRVQNDSTCYYRKELPATSCFCSPPVFCGHKVTEIIAALFLWTLPWDIHTHPWICN